MTTTARGSGGREWAAARRAAALAHHPDVGGDPDAFITTLAAIDTTFGRVGSDPGEPTVTIVVRHPHWRRVTTAFPRAVRRLVASRHHYARL